MRKAMLARIRNEGMSEDDVAKMMAVFDSQGSKNIFGGIWSEYTVFIIAKLCSNDIYLCSNQWLKT